MTTYYRDASVLVNSDTIIVDGRRYPIADLDDVWLERGAWQPELAMAVLVMRVLVAAAALGLVVVIAAVAFAPHHPGQGRVPDLVVWGYLLASPFVLGALILGAQRIRDRGIRPLTLWAQVAGEEVRLYGTTDERRFGQVHRAVLRALERNGR